MESKGHKLTKGLSQDAIYEDIQGEENSSDLEVVEMTIDETMSRNQYATVEGHSNSTKEAMHAQYENGLPVESRVTRSLTIKQTHLIEKAEVASPIIQDFSNNSVEQAD